MILLRPLLLALTLSLSSFALHAAQEKQPVSEQKIEEIQVYSELDDIVLGTDEAPIMLVEYSSINCTHCANFHHKAFQNLKEKYIDTKKVQMVFKHFPLDYQAVEYMSLVAKQPHDKWMGLLDIAYERQEEWIGKPPETLAKILGISPEDCKAARACEHTKELIMAKRFNAEQVIDIEATPTFHLFYKVNGVEKNLLINKGITPKDLTKKLDEILKIADKIST